MRFQDKGVHGCELVGINIQSILCPQHQEFVGPHINMSKCGYVNPTFLLNIVHGPRNEWPDYCIPEGVVGQE